MSAEDVFSFLDRFEECIPSIPEEHVPSLIEAFLMAGDDILSICGHGRYKLFFGAPTMLTRSLLRLVKRLPAAIRESTLLECIAKARGVTLATYITQYFVQEREKSVAAAQATFSDEELLRLREQTTSRVRQSADSMQLVLSPELPYVMHRWADWTTPEEVGGWLKEALASSAEHRANVFRGFAQELNGKLRCDPKWFERFVEPATLLFWADELKTWLPAARQFLNEHAMRQEGLDPDLTM